MNDIHHKHTPLYAQYAAEIREKIMVGELKPGDRLHSILTAAKESGLSAGTIKQAYKVLTDEGYLSMVRGSGTVVRDSSLPSMNDGDLSLIPAGKQLKAEKAIDSLFQELIDLKFSLSEIRILFDLKLRQLVDESSKLTIGVIDCNPEARHMMADKIAENHDFDIFEYGLETVLSFPERVPEDLSLIFTTTTHANILNETLPPSVKVNPLALSPTAETISAIAKLRSDEKIALIAYSHEFIGIMLRTIHSFGDPSSKPVVYHFGTSASFNKLLSGKNQVDAVILPANYERFSSKAEQETIHQFEKSGGKVILFEYQMDHGSSLLVERLIERAEKQNR